MQGDLKESRNGYLSTLAMGDHRVPGFGVPGELDLYNDQPTGRFYGYEVGVTAAQQHLLTDHHQLRVSGLGQDLRCLFYQVMEGLLIGEASRSQQAPA